MKKQQIQSATSLPPSPDEERRGRMIKYSVMMAIRLVCFIVAIVVAHWWGWWALIPVVGAILLPYFAVVVANTVNEGRVRPVERPGGLARVGASDPDEKR